MNKINFKPIKDRILAERIFEEVKMQESGGLITSLNGISEIDLENKSKLMDKIANNKSFNNTAKVVRVGKDVKEVSEGDVIHINGKFLHLKHNSEDYILLKEEDVNGIIEP